MNSRFTFLMMAGLLSAVSVISCSEIPSEVEATNPRDPHSPNYEIPATSHFFCSSTKHDSQPEGTFMRRLSWHNYANDDVTGFLLFMSEKGDSLNFRKVTKLTKKTFNKETESFYRTFRGYAYNWEVNDQLLNPLFKLQSFYVGKYDTVFSSPSYCQRKPKMGIRVRGRTFQFTLGTYNIFIERKIKIQEKSGDNSPYQTIYDQIPEFSNAYFHEREYSGNREDYSYRYIVYNNADTVDWQYVVPPQDN